MKVVEAVWEKRNLGVSCNEIEISEKDNLEEIKEKYHQFADCQYLVLKVPPQKIDVMSFLQQQGCVYIETLFHLSTNIKQLLIPKTLKPMLKKCSWEIMDRGDFDILQENIKRTVFTTDRVFLDPYFSNEQAATRYINWLDDLYQKGIVPYKVKYKEVDIGFFVNKKITDYAIDGVLSGIYPEFIDVPGLGSCVSSICFVAAGEQGFKKYITRVSSNNIIALKTNINFGMKIKELKYVFIRHCN